MTFNIGNFIPFFSIAWEMREKLFIRGRSKCEDDGRGKPTLSQQAVASSSS